jgi:integration host factor subunit beta
MTVPTKSTITKSELVDSLSADQPYLSPADVENAVNYILDRMIHALTVGERIEIRGFGSMTVRYRPPRLGRNPKTGETVKVPEKYVPVSSQELGYANG